MPLSHSFKSSLCTLLLVASPALTLHAQQLTLEGQTGGFLTPTAYVVYNEFFRHEAGPRRAGSAGRTEAGQVTRIYFNTLRWVERRAFYRSEMQTPSEYVRRLRTEFDPEVAARLGQLTELAEQAFYGPDAVTANHVRAAKVISGKVVQALREQKARAKRRPLGKDASPQKSAGGKSDGT